LTHYVKVLSNYSYLCYYV